jgi:hypothetical protein
MWDGFQTVRLDRRFGNRLQEAESSLKEGTMPTAEPDRNRTSANSNGQPGTTTPPRSASSSTPGSGSSTKSGA